MSEKEIRYIQPPNNLRQKQKMHGIGNLDPAWIDAAERSMLAAKFDYLAAAGEDLAKLQTAFDAAKKDPANRPAHVRDIYAMVQSIKGQGTTFGYPLMSAVGNQLARFLEDAGETLTDPQMEVVKVHVEAARLIIQQKMEGESQIGQKIVAGLALVVKKMIGDMAPSAG